MPFVLACRTKMTTSYRSQARFVVDAIHASLTTSLQLVEAAKTLGNAGHSGPSLSLAVIGIEEVGKMILVDGLAFAKSSDERSVMYDKMHRDHRSKLAAIDVFPFALQQYATLDPRYGTPQFAQTFILAVDAYRRSRQALEPWIGHDVDLRQLDKWKQKGFYADIDRSGQRIVPPSATVDCEFAEAVGALAWRLGDSLQFVLKNSYENHVAFIERVRSNLSDSDFARIRAELEPVIVDILNSPAPATD